MMVSKGAATSILFAATLASPAAMAAGTAVEPAAAAAAASRTYVSSKGADTAACSLPAPCRTLTRAHAQTLAGGEVVIMDSGGYGSVTITKAISIVNDGTGTAFVTAPPNGAAVTINAGAGTNVYLRGLEIDGQKAAASTGIIVTSGNLDIAGSTLTRTVKTGISVANASSNITVSESTFSEGGTGISAQGSGKVVVDRSRFVNLSYGVTINAAGNTAIKNSVFTNLKVFGVFSGGGPSTVLAIQDSQISGCATGIDNDTATVLIGRNVITGNSSYGISNGVGPMYSDGTNEIRGNGTDVNGTITNAGTQ